REQVGQLVSVVLLLVERAQPLESLFGGGEERERAAEQLFGADVVFQPVAGEVAGQREKVGRLLGGGHFSAARLIEPDQVFDAAGSGERLLDLREGLLGRGGGHGNFGARL